MSALPTTQEKTILDATNYKGAPAERSKTGGWSASAMILGGEVMERMTTLGIAVNLVTYLTGTMHLGNAESANVVTNFLGTSFMLCLLGGFLADTFLGRYRTIAIFAAVQATGVAILAMSTKIPSLHPPKCTGDSGGPCERATSKQLTVLYLALYMTALGTGGLKSSVSGFGSDQFDDTDEKERKQMLKFFNWFYFFVSTGSLAAVTVLVYIQDNQGRVWGYGICAVAILVALTVFLSGTKKYRYKKPVGSPLTQIAVVFVAAWRKRRLQPPSDSSFFFHEDYIQSNKQRLPHSNQFRFLDKAAMKDSSGTEAMKNNKWYLTTLTDVEEVKLVLRMLPIWATTIMFWCIHAQMTTFSVSQAVTMDCHIGKTFKIPPASMTVFLIGTILLTVPFYDRFVAPVAKKLLMNPHGLSPLQRVGTGLVFSVLSMVAAAAIEIKRLKEARSHGLVHTPHSKIPMTVFWLVPQFFLVGVGEAFMYMGQLDFFLRECPKGMKTMSTGLFLSTLALGFFFSSLLVSIVNKLTAHGKPWLADNLNQGKLYDFYWLLALLSAINVVIYFVAAKWYVYKEKRFAEVGIELEEQENVGNFH
ncbi:protein NRT1/ PTR FAMILY 6.3 [Arachis duranensis]|uniref:Protein NRT1/ PTR FAMILY 6.3 n=1 Tax=Arachis duranensis TaxID=130453 RepID=A0A6P4DBN8_ARADU|nr:protein NRT1/ PTR FAMILY 6.3 [Arachis duranensis]